MDSMMGRAKIVNVIGNGSIAVNRGSNAIGTPIPMIKPIEIPIRESAAICKK